MKKVHLLALMAALYAISFIAIEWLGVFSAQPTYLRGILSFWLVLVSSLAVLVLLFVSVVVNRSRMVRAHWLGVFSVVLMVAGIWIMRLTDFGINVVLTEGQVYETQEHRSLGLLYAGMISPVPKFRLKLDKVTLDADQHEAVDRMRAVGKLRLLLPGGTSPSEITLTQGMPKIHNRIFLKVKSYGYSLRYAIKKTGKILDSDFISMRLYPPGNEDYFRLLSPHTFYVRYYPGHQEDGVERPLKVKIARNKDILFNEYTDLGDVIRFEDAEISFEEMRKWVEVSIRRNWGELIALAGLGLGCISAAMLILRRIKPRES
jgi:hypothetical protein